MDMCQETTCRKVVKTQETSSEFFVGNGNLWIWRTCITLSCHEKHSHIFVATCQPCLDPITMFPNAWSHTHFDQCMTFFLFSMLDICHARKMRSLCLLHLTCKKYVVHPPLKLCSDQDQPARHVSSAHRPQSP